LPGATASLSVSVPPEPSPQTQLPPGSTYRLYSSVSWPPVRRIRRGTKPPDTALGATLTRTVGTGLTAQWIATTLELLEPAPPSGS